MADEEMERNSPRSTSEATPPHIDDSPEMVSQPSPPEEQRVSSSTDTQLPEVADSPEEQNISSTFNLESNEVAGPSRQLSAVEMLLLETNEVVTSREGSSLAQDSDATPEVASQPNPNVSGDSRLRQLLEAPPILSPPVIDVGLVRAAFGSPLLQAALEAAKVAAARQQALSSEEISKDYIEQNIEEKSDSNKQLDADDSPSTSKSSPKNVDLERNSSATESSDDKSGQRSAKETAALKNVSSTKMSAIEEKSCSETALENQFTTKTVVPVILVSPSGATDNTGLKTESSPSKPDSALLSSESGSTENVGVKGELSPAKQSTSSPEASGSAPFVPDRRRDIFSPKRKSPTKFQHLPPKRTTPSPDKPRRQSDSQMTTLLEELDIQETDNKPGISPVLSGINTEMEETSQSENEESSMEVEETNSQTKQTEKSSKMEESD